MVKMDSISDLEIGVKYTGRNKGKRAGLKNILGSVKHIVPLCLLICFVFVRLSHAQFTAGEGTIDNPYQITTWVELNELRNYLGSSNEDKQFQLMNDLDSNTEGYSLFVMNNDTLSNDGKGWIPIGFGSSSSFSGTFNGGGYFICDIRIEQTDPIYSGLFGCLGETGVVTNLNVKRGIITAQYYVGGIIGYNYGTVSNSSFSGTVYGNSNVGGLVGYNYDGVITCCYSNASVETNGQWTGGLVGYNSDGGTISNCYSTASVSGWASVGGLVGINYGSVKFCYSAGNVSGNMYTGSLIGYDNNGQYQSCFCTGTTESSVGSKEDAPDGIEGKTFIEMTARSAFNGWDFTSIWDIKTGDTISYPFLMGVIQGSIPGQIVNPTQIVSEGNRGTNSQKLTAFLSGNVLTLSFSLTAGTLFSLIDLSGREVIAGLLKGNTYNVKTLSSEMYVLRITVKDVVRYIKVMQR